MKRVIIVLSATTAVFLVYIAFAQESSPPKPPAWEYKVLTVYELTDVKSVFDLLESESDEASRESPEQPEKDGPEKANDNAKPSASSGVEKLRGRIQNGLNKLGTDGWELVAADETFFYFKRQAR